LLHNSSYIKAYSLSTTTFQQTTTLHTQPQLHARTHKHTHTHAHLKVPGKIVILRLAEVLKLKALNVSLQINLLHVLEEFV